MNMFVKIVVLNFSEPLCLSLFFLTFAYGNYEFLIVLSLLPNHIVYRLW